MNDQLFFINPVYALEELVDILTSKSLVLNFLVALR
jgi:hypothetical protein